MSKSADIATRDARIAELEAALAAATAPKVRVADRVGECECGCGAKVTGKARFQMGHDAKLKSALIAVALTADPIAGPEAEAKLVTLGWVAFLHAARDRKAAKVAKRLAAKAAREAAEVALAEAETDPDDESDDEADEAE